MGKKGRGAGACKGNKDQTVVGRLLGTRERLNLTRLERLVVKEAETLKNYCPPPPPPPPREVRVDEDGMVTLKRRARSGPDDWVLRGAARPWETLDDGTLDPNGRAYYIVETGVDLFSRQTLRGGFGFASEASHAHVTHLRELASALAGAARQGEALEAASKALALDVTDGNGQPPREDKADGPQSGKSTGCGRGVDVGGSSGSSASGEGAVALPQLRAAGMVRLLLGFGDSTLGGANASKVNKPANASNLLVRPDKPMPNAPRPTKKAKRTIDETPPIQAHPSSLCNGCGGGGRGGGQTLLGKSPNPSSAASSASAATPPLFVAATQFSGPRPGMSFKKGPKGVGYYADGNNTAASRQSAAALTRAAALAAVTNKAEPKVVRRVMTSLRSAAPVCTAAAAGALLLSLILDHQPFSTTSTSSSPKKRHPLSDPEGDFKALLTCNPYAAWVLAKPGLFAEAAAAAAATSTSSPVLVADAEAVLAAMAADGGDGPKSDGGDGQKGGGGADSDDVDSDDSDGDDDDGGEKKSAAFAKLKTATERTTQSPTSLDGGSLVSTTLASKRSQPSKEWAQASEALMYAATEEKVWAWALGDTNDDGDDGGGGGSGGGGGLSREVLLRSFQTCTSPSAAGKPSKGEAAAAVDVTAGASDAEFPAARRFLSAWKKRLD